MKSLLLILLIVVVNIRANAQLFQRIKGQILDKESQAPLEGVLVAIIDLNPVRTALTDVSGRFSIDSIPIGKHHIACNFLSYHELNIPDVLVTSGREVVLNILMQESARRLAEQVVSVKRRSMNDRALASVKTFDVQETERYAGSRGDPARMASNFAGVQGADDSRNDIIVRGNSPSGLLWRIEDVDIINPNHFAIPGTSGGPVSLLNNKTLANSDFLTGAFPAEYGNTISAAFDLKLRNGNTDRYEMSAQLGFLGTELMAEGPISKKNRSSFLVAYRYSTLQLFQGLNIKIGTESVPNYQDLTFKLNFPIGKHGDLSFFGIGGLSHIDLIVSNLSKPPQELYGESDRDQYFTSNTGIGGLSYTHLLNKQSFIKIVSVFSANDIYANHNKVFRDADYQVDSLKPILGYRFLTNSWNTHLFFQKKINARNSFRLGIIDNVFFLNLIDSSRQDPPTRQDWQNRLDFIGSTSLLQAYVEYKYRPTDQLSISGGLHAQYLTHNQSKALEPRLAARWTFAPGQALSLAYGLHSVMQPLYQYFAHLPGTPADAQLNRDMGFTRSHHFVAGYDRALGKHFQLRLESYFQYLFDIPIEIRPGSSFSNINQGSSFSRVFPDSLKNAGTGQNYGLELTLEKAFSRSYYVMFTGSLYNSRYKGNDGVSRSTDYNGNFATNFLAGYEPKLSANTTLITGAKISFAGGQLYSPPDVAASNALGDFVVIDSLRNSERFPNYFRADLKLGIRINRPKVTHEIAIDLVNIFGTKNVLNLTYSPELATQGQYPFLKSYQLGFLPLFYYKMDFGWRAR
ncbi:MAG: TonB-dependent receptor [Chitinophagaceae bacterium]